MNTKKLLRLFIIFSVLLINVACDQVSKNVVRKNITEGENIRFVNDHFTITKVENTGAFLSLGNQIPEIPRFILLSLLPSLALLLAVIYLIWKHKVHVMLLVGCCFVIGGGIGNLYDRIVHGSVTDFMHIDFGIFQTGIFNMADISIMLGIGIILMERSIIAPRSAKIDMHSADRN